MDTACLPTLHTYIITSYAMPMLGKAGRYHYGAAHRDSIVIIGSQAMLSIRHCSPTQKFGDRDFTKLAWVVFQCGTFDGIYEMRSGSVGCDDVT